MAGSEEHIKPLDLARRKDFRLSEREEEHVRQCDECQLLLEDFAGRINKPDKPKDPRGAK